MDQHDVEQKRRLDASRPPIWYHLDPPLDGITLPRPPEEAQESDQVERLVWALIVLQEHADLPRLREDLTKLEGSALALFAHNMRDVDRWRRERVLGEWIDELREHEGRAQHVVPDAKKMWTRQVSRFQKATSSFRHRVEDRRASLRFWRSNSL